MNTVLVDGLRLNGWSNPLNDGITWTKNGITFNLELDNLVGCQDGSVISFRNHGEASSLRLRVAEKLAKYGTFTA